MDITRREFLKWTVLTGATIALAGCASPPHQALVSQLELPEYRLPGEAKWFATTCQECAGGCGVAVRMIDGRAKKIEGIPEHPVNHGKVCAKGQSSVQALYNPDRLTAILKRQGGGMIESRDWSEVTKVLAGQLQAARAKKGSLLWITSSLHGTGGGVLALLAERAGAKIWMLDSAGVQAQRAAMKGLTGKAELPYYSIAQADYVVNFGNDLFANGNLPVHDAWQYGEFRQGKNRSLRGILVSFSPRMNLTDASSDKWVPVHPGTEGWVALGLGNVIARSKKGNWPAWASTVSLEKISRLTGVAQDTFERLGKRLLEAKHPLAIAGAHSGSASNGVWTVGIIGALNRLLSGKIEAFEPSLIVPQAAEKEMSAALFVSSRDALNGLKQGTFETVWVLDTNPRYLLPSALNFEKYFSQIKNKIVFSPFPTETGLLADWAVPTQTWYESWGDRLMEGPFGPNQKPSRIYNFQQPVVAPLGESRNAVDVILEAAQQGGGALLHGWPGGTLRDILSSRFKKDEGSWENLLVRGGVWENYPLDWELYRGSKTHPLYPPPPVKGIAKAPSGMNPWEHLKKAEMLQAVLPNFSGTGQVLIPFQPLALGDGSLANRPWMQELPDPLTTVTWTHWVELPAALAQKLGVERGDVVRLTSRSGTLLGPAFPNTALHEDCVAVPVGQGHDHYGRYADRGANPLSILDPVWQEETGEPAWVGTRVGVEKVGTKARMTTQDERVDQYPKEFMPL